nr:MAG TPA: hypothetical protein [Caudoviricetes sp.]
MMEMGRYMRRLRELKTLKQRLSAVAVLLVVPLVIHSLIQ